MAEYDAQYWIAQLKAAKEYRRVTADAEQWGTWRNYYEGNWGSFHDGIMGRNSLTLPVNLVFAYGKKFVSSTVSSFPNVIAKPIGAGTLWDALVAEQLARVLFTRLPLVENIRRSVLDNYLVGTGVLKRGYGSQYGYVPAKGPGGKSKKGEFIEYGPLRGSKLPWLRRHQTEDYLIPWGTQCIEDIHWEAFKHYPMLEDLKADARFSKTSGLKGGPRPVWDKIGEGTDSKPIVSTLTPGEDKGEAAPPEFCPFWEIYDYRRNRIICVVEPEEQIIMDQNAVLVQTGHPIGYTLRFNEGGRSYWGISDVKNIEPQQLEANDIRTQMSAARRASVLRFLVRKGAIKKVELEKILSGIPNVAAFVEGIPKDVIAELHPSIPMDLIPAMEQVRSDIREMIGLSRNQRGEAMGGRATATEANIVSAGAEENTGDRRNDLNRVLAEAVSGMLDSIIRFWPDEKVINIVGPDNQPYWLKFKASALEKKFTIDIDVTAGIPYTQQLRRAEMEKMVGVMSQTQSPQLGEAMKYYLATFPYIDQKGMMKAGAEQGRNPGAPVALGDAGRVLGGQNANV